MFVNSVSFYTYGVNKKVPKSSTGFIGKEVNFSSRKEANKNGLLEERAKAMTVCIGCILLAGSLILLTRKFFSKSFEGLLRVMRTD